MAVHHKVPPILFRHDLLATKKHVGIESLMQYGGNIKSICVAFCKFTVRSSVLVDKDDLFCFEGTINLFSKILSTYGQYCFTVCAMLIESDRLKPGRWSLKGNE